MSDEGWHFANAIIAKLIKKRSDCVEFRNISGFIHTCVNNARQEMAGMGMDRRPSYARASGASSSSAADDQESTRQRAELSAQSWAATWDEPSSRWSSGWGAGWRSQS